MEKENNTGIPLLKRDDKLYYRGFLGRNPFLAFILIIILICVGVFSFDWVRTTDSKNTVYEGTWSAITAAPADNMVGGAITSMPFFQNSHLGAYMKLGITGSYSQLSMFGEVTGDCSFSFDHNKGKLSSNSSGEEIAETLLILGHLIVTDDGGVTIYKKTSDAYEWIDPTGPSDAQQLEQFAEYLGYLGGPQTQEYFLDKGMPLAVTQFSTGAFSTNTQNVSAGEGEDQAQQTSGDETARIRNVATPSNANQTGDVVVSGRGEMADSVVQQPSGNSGQNQQQQQ